MDDDIVSFSDDSGNTDIWENVPDSEIPVGAPEVLGVKRRNKSVDFFPPFQMKLTRRFLEQGDSGAVLVLALLAIRQHAMSPKKPLSMASEAVTGLFPERRTRRRAVLRLEEAYSDWFQVTNHGTGKPKTLTLTEAGVKALTVKGKG